MTTCLVYNGRRRFARYLNWSRRNLGDSFVVPDSEWAPLVVRVDAITSEQRTFLDELFAMTKGAEDEVVMAPDDPAEVTLDEGAATRSALEASPRDWRLGGTPRVEWAREYDRYWVVSIWYFQNMPPGHAYIVDKATGRAFERRWIDGQELRSTR